MATRSRGTAAFVCFFALLCVVAVESTFHCVKESDLAAYVHSLRQHDPLYTLSAECQLHDHTFIAIGYERDGEAAGRCADMAYAVCLVRQDTRCSKWLDEFMNAGCDVSSSSVFWLMKIFLFGFFTHTHELN